MAGLKINVIIAGRTYPLTVKNTEEEQGVRKAAKQINELIANFEQSYAVADKQDVLAMCALQFASRIEVNELKNDKHNLEAQQQIQQIADMLDKYI